MLKRILTLVVLASLTACVSQKKYDKLDRDYANLSADYDTQSSQLEDCDDQKDMMTSELDKLHEDFDALEEEKNAFEKQLTQKKSDYDKLSDSYNALEANSSKVLSENASRNRELLKELEVKEEKLAKEQARLEKMQKDLSYREKRINELESMIAAEEEKMNTLKENLSKALVNFEDRGLSVEQRDGKVYVSMENKLLFSSGSWSVGNEGQQAVKELGKVLASNSDINVLIEGHTDNVPYNGSGALKDNWDLSTKRATEVLKLLIKNSNINPKNLTAAGRGEFAPVASNSSRNGKAKNRRIEVVLTPKFDEISKLLKE